MSTYLDKLEDQGRPAAYRADEDRTLAFFDYLIDRGAVERWGPFWQTPERVARFAKERPVFIQAGYITGAIMLAGVMDFCRREHIPYGAGRGSAPGSLILYALGITEVDPLEWDLLFERFLNPDRVSFPDVDLDFSQEHRHRVLQFVVDNYNTGDQIVLQIGAFVRAGGRAVVDLMFAAMADTDLNAGATATNLKKCFPETGSIVGGQKLPRELHAWLYEGKGHGDKQRFIDIATQAGWLDTLLLLDGMFTHLGKHAAGVVILRKEDLPVIPLVTVKDSKGNQSIITGYDMYSLDDLGYPKWDFLGLRTLDVIAEAHKFDGGSGDTRDLIQLWKEHKDDIEVYEEIFQTADTVGIFQMETDGYRRTLRDFQPTCFDHLVQLVALYRPGALDYVREDGKNMVEVFIDRLHGREPVTYDHPKLKPILEPTFGIILYQEQQMKIAQELAGFTLAQADALRKAIGKKLADEMKRLMVLFREGCAKNGIEPAVIDRITKNIEAAARYSWNKSHAVAYAIPTWHTAWFKYKRTPFYTALINSYEDKKDKQANVIAEARQHTTFRPPDVNVAEERFIVDGGETVFGLNGIKGMGETNRNAILIERAIGGPYQSYEDFCARLPSVPTNMKRSLVACGAFDSLGEDRVRLLATIPKGNRAWQTSFSCGCTSRKQKPLEIGEVTRCSKHKTEHVLVIGVQEIERKGWAVLEHVNESAKSVAEGKAPKPLPTDVTEFDFPSDTQLAQGELDAMGYYISTVPMAALNRDLAILPAGTVGGEVASIQVKEDKNGNDYANIHITTAALTKQRVLMFWSAWSTSKSRVKKGTQLLFRGRLDGDTLLADACWAPGDYRHFRKIKVWKGDTPETSEFDGTTQTVRSLEQAGYRIRLL